MEKKLPDDQLENFLRNSLKDYSEKPSEDVWEKIDHSLDHQINQTPSIKKWKWILSAAAVTGIMIFLAANNIYLKNKLKKEIEINKSIAHRPQDKTTEPSNPVSTPNQTPGSENTTKTKDNSEINASSLDSITSQLPATALNQNKTFEHSEKQSAETVQIENKTKNQTGFLKNKPNPYPLQNKEFKSDQKNKTNKSALEKINSQELSDNKLDRIKYPDKNTSDLNQVQLETKSTLSKILPADENVEGNIKPKKTDADPSSTLKPEEPKINRAVFNLADVPGTQSNAVSSLSGGRIIQAKSLTGMIPVKIPTNDHGSGLSLLGGTIYESGTLIDLRRPNNQTINPSENKFTTHQSWSIGLGYSKSINKNWFVSTGLALKNYELVNDINQSLMFGGRINPGPGGLPFHHDWAFKLNCPGGTSNITIQSEQLDSRATISDNEQVNVNITNKEKLKYLTIPLSMNYRAALGKLTWFAGLGLHMNILTESHFENPTIHINHPQLVTRSEPNKNYHFDKSNPVVWNGSLSAGLVYPILPRWSIQISPSWFIPVTNRNSDRDIRVQSTSFALQFGLNYSLAAL